MNEKYHYGIETTFVQGVYDVEFAKVGDDIIAKKISSCPHTIYEIFGYAGLNSNERSVLHELVILKNKRTIRNQYRLFQQFINKYGFINTGLEQSMNQFWEEVDKMATLINRYEQIINKKTKELQEWIICKPLKSVITKKNLDTNKFPNLKEWVIKNSETEAAKEGYKTRVVYKNSYGSGLLEVKIDMNEIENNPTAYYQLFGFNYILGVLDRIDIKGSLKTGKLNIIQKNRYTPIEEITTEPNFVIKDMKSALYAQLLTMVTRKQKICASCFKPFPPSRENNIYCGDTCKNRKKKERQRKRK
ncbi:hypothetical protein [Priestia megaterium]|uniref:hypothetical protein n=1 Tax=Priestia megaterium TaxID=1404 RepID=UPI0028774BF8|nr:hypothetical protein [Priestia megaterium]